MSKTIITIDPGEHIGLICVQDEQVFGLTIIGDNRNAQLWSQLAAFKPDVIVYEKFALRANMASKLVGNKFITCEVIGVIKLYCQLHKIEPVILDPFMKEYCGFSSSPKDEHYKKINILDTKITEHVRDAYRLYSYYNLFKNKINLK